MPAFCLCHKPLWDSGMTREAQSGQNKNYNSFKLSCAAPSPKTPNVGAIVFRGKEDGENKD